MYTNMSFNFTHLERYIICNVGYQWHKYAKFTNYMLQMVIIFNRQLLTNIFFISQS